MTDGTGNGLDGREVGVRVPVGGKIFLLFTLSRPVLGLTQWVPGVKRSRREPEHTSK
jgi:hypothetical protein